MAKPISRTYSRHNRHALVLLGNLIRTERIKRRWTAQDTAQRAGVSRGLLQRVEKGDPKCEIGLVFELATIMGIQLFDADETAMINHIRHAEEKLSLLPKAVRKKAKPVDDEF